MELQGGPAGVTVSYFLQDVLGNDADITIYEANGKEGIGGQSQSPIIDGYHMELGTVCLTPGYTAVRQLAKRVGMIEDQIYNTQYLKIKDKYIKRDNSTSLKMLIYSYDA